MPTPTLYAPDQDNDHSQPGDAIAKGQQERTEQASHLHDLENTYNPPARENPKDLSPEALAKAEQNSQQTNTQQGANILRNPLNVAKSKAKQKAKRSIMKKLRGVVTPKRALVGGGLLSGLAILAIMVSGFSAFELINLRENSLGHGNKYMNRVLEKRRAQSFYKAIGDNNDTKKHPLGSPERVKRAKAVKQAFERKGFTVDIDEKQGTIKKFSFTDVKSGETRTLDLNAADPTKEVTRFFGSSKDSKFGLEASKAFDKVDSSRGGMWRGPGARLVYGTYRFAFFNWLDRKPKSESETPRERLAGALREASATEAAITVTGAQSKQELGDGQQVTDENGNKSTQSVTTGADVLAGELNNNISPAEYQEKMLKDPKLKDSIIGVKSNDYENLVNDTDKALDTGGITSESMMSNLAKGAFRGSLNALVRSFNIIGAAQAACEVKGILNFVANYRNIVLSIELARFAVRILNAADDQKAGILTSEGLNILMIYMTTPNPANGKGHTGSGGEQFLFGDHAARPSKTNKSLYGVGRNNDGILGRITGFVNNVPGINHCNVVQNGFVSVAGLAVGVAASVGSGGAETAANIATILTLAAMHQIVVQTATPMLIKAGAHIIANGYENGEAVGDMYASGFGGLSGMVGSSSGVLPSTNAQITAMNSEVEAHERMLIADQSIFERYFSPANNDSLATRVAMTMPASFHAAAVSFSSSMTSVLHSITSFSFLGGLLPGAHKTYALDSGCTDPQIKKLNIATDPFCNPIMARIPDLDMNETERILSQNKQIDDKGNPTATKVGDDKSFAEFRDLCMKARPTASAFYNPNPDKNGSGSFTDDTCALHGSPLPGDTKGRYDRFANWYGYRNDSTSFDEHIGVSSVETSDTSYQSSGATVE